MTSVGSVKCRAKPLGAYKRKQFFCSACSYFLTGAQISLFLLKNGADFELNDEATISRSLCKESNCHALWFTHSLRGDADIFKSVIPLSGFSSPKGHARLGYSFLYWCIYCY